MLKSGITKRWLFTTVLVIAVIFTAFALLVIFSIRSYYYDYVEKRLQTLGQSSAVSDFFNGYIDVSNDTFAERAGEYLRSSSALSVAEVWVFNKKDEIVVTSTGFAAEDGEKEDYEIARSSPSGRGLAKTVLPSGERVMALTVFLPRTGEQSNGAIRYMVSIEDINNKLQLVAFLISFFCLFAFVMVLLSGSFFVRSIVVPVKKINGVTREIAQGKYTEKVQVPNRFDEIAELSASINDMTDALARTDRLKNDFISTVSHELRTPLTAIKGWTETLIAINESDDKTLGDGLKVIQTEAERLYSMVEELLDFSRIESGRMGLRLQKIDVIAELDEAVYVMTDRAAREGKEILYSSPERVAQMDGDPDRLKQVFVNVIDNALKYTAPGGKISIVAAFVDSNLRISVADTGCGIPAEALPHVKEKFYKANMSVKGSGIGLAVCDEIVSLHGGALSIQSTENEGTTVEITLPLAASNTVSGS